MSSAISEDMSQLSEVDPVLAPVTEGNDGLKGLQKLVESLRRVPRNPNATRCPVVLGEKSPPLSHSIQWTKGAKQAKKEWRI
jgi:hypothetical protein